MYICFIRDSHEPWTYWLIFFIIFVLSYHNFSSYLFVYILCSIICLCHRVSFYAMSDDLSYLSAWKIVMSLSIPISWTLARKSLVEKIILLERVHVHHCLRVYPFHYVFSEEFIYWYLGYARVKEKKEKKEEVINACIWCYSPLNVYIGHWDCFIELVAYESSYVNFQETFISLCLSRYVFYV